MKKSIEIDVLRNRIEFLEAQRSIEYLELKDEFDQTINVLKPTYIVKKTLRELLTSSEITDSIMSNSIGIATGYISRKLIVGKSINPIKQVLGLFLQYSVARAVAKHPQAIKAVGFYIIGLFSRKKRD